MSRHSLSRALIAAALALTALGCAQAPVVRPQTQTSPPSPLVEPCDGRAATCDKVKE